MASIDRSCASSAIQSELAQFTGTDNWYRHFSGLLFTDGVHYLAERCGAYWLIDLIGSYQRDRRIRQNERLRDFQLWTLRRNGRGAVAICKEDSGQNEPVRIQQRIEFTDFPLPEIKLYVEGGVLLLPSER